MFGELLATRVRAPCIAGVVIEAGVRDVARITAMQFPVFFRERFFDGNREETGRFGEYRGRFAGAIVHIPRHHREPIRWCSCGQRAEAAEVVLLS